MTAKTVRPHYHGREKVIATLEAGPVEGMLFVDLTAQTSINVNHLRHICTQLARCGFVIRSFKKKPANFVLKGGVQGVHSYSYLTLKKHPATPQNTQP